MELYAKTPRGVDIGGSINSIHLAHQARHCRLFLKHGPQKSWSKIPLIYNLAVHF
jgi:hypothetical protein